MSDNSEQPEHDRQREPIIDSALDVEQKTEASRHFLATDDRSGKDWIGRAKNRADEQRDQPRQRGECMAEQRSDQQRER